MISTGLLAAAILLPTLAGAQAAPVGWWKSFGPPPELAGRELAAVLVGSGVDGRLDLATEAGLWRGTGEGWRLASPTSFLPEAIVFSPTAPDLAVAVANLPVFLSNRFSFPTVVTGFLERSLDGGRTFERCAPGASPPLPIGSGAQLGENRAISDVAFDPVQPGVVLLATGDGLLAVDLFRCAPAVLLDPLPLASLVALPGASGTVLVAATRERAARLLRSADGGGSWTVAVTESRERWTLTAGSGTVAWALGGRPDGGLELWVSAREGRNWRSAGELPVRGAPLQLLTRGPLLFAVVDDRGGEHSLWRSRDGGESWDEVTPLPRAALSRLESHLRGLSWSAGGRLFESAGEGDEWVEIARPVAPRSHALLARDGRLLSLDVEPAIGSTQDGSLVSRDRGTTWSAANVALPPGLRVADLRELRSSPSSGAVYATTDSGTTPLISEDGGETWAAIAAPHGGRLAVLGRGPTRNDDELFLVAECPSTCEPGSPGSVSRSSDGGATWRRISEPGIGAVADVDVATFGERTVVVTVGSEQPTIVPTRSDQIAWSVDGGVTFRFAPTAPSTRGPLVWVRVMGLAEGESADPAPELLVGSEGGIHRSVDGGATWRSVGIHPGAFQSLRAVVDPDDPRRLFLATTRGVYESLNAGASWSELRGLASGLPMNGLAFDPSDRTLWVSTGAGVLARSRPRPEECEVGESRLCLSGERFLTEARYRVPDGAEDVARAVEITGDTGAFWFFDPDNLELLVKVLDGCALNGSWWVFATGLTDVEAEIVVVDSRTSEEWRRGNGPGGPFQPIFDVDAFPCEGARGRR